MTDKEHEASFVMTDEFVEFSKIIAGLHEAKKAKTAELKEIYASFQKVIAIREVISCVTRIGRFREDPRPMSA